MQIRLAGTLFTLAALMTACLGGDKSGGGEAAGGSGASEDSTGGGSGGSAPATGGDGVDGDGSETALDPTVCSEFAAYLRECGTLSAGRVICGQLVVEGGSQSDACVVDCLTAEGCTDNSDAFLCNTEGDLGELSDTTLAACLSACSGFCVDSDNICNGEVECPGGADEADCFSCGANDSIPGGWECDGTPDCPGGEDEADCDNVARLCG